MKHTTIKRPNPAAQFPVNLRRWPLTYYSSIRWQKKFRRFVPDQVHFVAGDWRAEARYIRSAPPSMVRVATGPCRLIYRASTVMTARGVVAWGNIKEAAAHFAARNHQPALYADQCIADHARPRWMGPPPPIKPAEPAPPPADNAQLITAP